MIQQKLVDEIFHYREIFYGVYRAKTDLHIKYVICFVFSSFFEQDYLVNLIILGVYAKR